jgi:hypothetical protein
MGVNAFWSSVCCTTTHRRLELVAETPEMLLLTINPDLRLPLPAHLPRHHWGLPLGITTGDDHIYMQ